MRWQLSSAVNRIDRPGYENALADRSHIYYEIIFEVKGLFLILFVDLKVSELLLIGNCFVFLIVMIVSFNGLLDDSYDSFY